MSDEGKIAERTSAEPVAGPEIAGAEIGLGTGSRSSGSVHSWVRDLVVSVAVSAFIIIFLYQPVRVEGTSMLPVLEDQDRLFINKIAYRVGDIHQGDVVVFQYPHDHTKSYIKRVIALPGDRIRIDRRRGVCERQAAAGAVCPQPVYGRPVATGDGAAG